MKVSIERIKERLLEMGKIGGTSRGGVNRPALSEEDKEARIRLENWFSSLDVATKVDKFGNMVGLWEVEGANQTVFTGSHLDSVPFGGKFDGPLGVIVALEVMQTLIENGIKPQLNLGVVNFTNEEGTRFSPATLASGGASGEFTEEYVYSRVDSSGLSFKEELEKIGYLGSDNSLFENGEAFVEMHIEQGSRLIDANCDVGIVEGIVGVNWLSVKLMGQSDHAGPTPMENRKDALLTFSRIHDKISALATKYDATITVGEINASPGSINVIPGVVEFTIDCRHQSDDVSKYLIYEINRIVKETSESQGVGSEVHSIWGSQKTTFDANLINQAKEISNSLDYQSMNLMSGAAHDAKYMNNLMPTVMIFVPTVDGKSHCEEELALWEDIEKCANVQLELIKKLITEGK